MSKKRRSWLSANSTQVVTSVITAVSVLGMAYLQFSDDLAPSEAPSCTQVRGEVITQAEKQPDSLSVPYPEDSPEETHCNINDFIEAITEG